MALQMASSLCFALLVRAAFVSGKSACDSSSAACAVSSSLLQSSALTSQGSALDGMDAVLAELTASLPKSSEIILADAPAQHQALSSNQKDAGLEVSSLEKEKEALVELLAREQGVQAQHLELLVQQQAEVQKVQTDTIVKLEEALRLQQDRVNALVQEQAREVEMTDTSGPKPKSTKQSTENSSTGWLEHFFGSHPGNETADAKLLSTGTTAVPTAAKDGETGSWLKPYLKAAVGGCLLLVLSGLVYALITS
eukprot:gb/GFBE01045181.1/.p1 GENE.gb/GFBE01045181.1/~~gb/GFBE01045181.1/.p1  ORF type:complete len:253 (+),score=63.52 gb/GFBE01045181.1/:1-759(+)